MESIIIPKRYKKGGKMLTDIMKSRNLKQVDIAEVLNVTQKTISVKLNKNKWLLAEAEEIRKFLGIDTIDEIFFDRRLSTLE